VKIEVELIYQRETAASYVYAEIPCLGVDQFFGKLYVRKRAMQDLPHRIKVMIEYRDVEPGAVETLPGQPQNVAR
jgi:hypothetical protein